MGTLTKEQETVEKLLPDIRATHKAFLKSGQETVELARQIGEMLLKLKTCMKHGEFTKAVEERCDFDMRSAQTYMKLSDGWAIVQKQKSPPTSIDGCVKLIGQAKPQKRSAVRISPKPADSGGAQATLSTPQPEKTAEPDESDESDGPCDDEPIAELTFEDQVKEANRKIESFCRDLTKFFADNCPKLDSVDYLGRYDSALAQVKSACGTLRTCKYHEEPCPRCKGEGCSKCAKESDFGAVTVLTYRQLAG